jgi:hypothetical protein
MSASSRETQIAALIEAEVQRAMEPYRALGLPADVLAELERLLRFGLKTHPSAQQLLRQLIDEPVLVESDSIETRGIVDAAKKGEGA